MRRKRNKQHTRRSAAHAGVVQQRNPGKIWLYRTLAGIVIPLIVLTGLELILRLAGVGYTTDFFLQKKLDGRDVWKANPEFGRRFFPKNAIRTPGTFAFATSKPTNTFRIFVFGESAALGDPLPRFGFSRYLERLLGARFPERRIEVVNVAMTAINSHVILPIARACADKSGDLWVIYLGNNEVIGPFGPGTAFGRGALALPLIRVALAAKTTRLGQTIDTLGEFVRGKDDQPEYWKGMKLMAERKIRHDDPRMTAVYANVRRNLHDILDTGERAGVPMILSTVAVNQRDCPPFASVLPPDGNRVNATQWQSEFDAGAGLHAAGRWEQALERYQKAAVIEPAHADLQYRVAMCFAALSRTNQASAALQLATDYDALRFRADSSINRIIREVGEQHRSTTHLIDSAELFDRSSPGLVAGRDLFYEHVHMTPRGNYVLARAVAEQTQRILAATATTSKAATGIESTERSEWLEQSECEKRIGYTGWNQSQALRIILDRFTLPPFPGTFEHASRLQELRSRAETAVANNTITALQEQARSIAEAVRQFPDDWDLRENLGLVLSMARDLEGAARELRAAIRLMPEAPSSHFSLAGVLAGQGKTDEAIAGYLESIRLEPNNFDAWIRLGILEIQRRRFTEAIPHFQEAIQSKPDSISARMYLGGTFLQLKRNAEAAGQFNAVLQSEPDHTEAKRLLRLAGRPVGGAVTR